MCNSLVPEQGSIIDVCVEGILMNVTGTHVRLQERAQAGECWVGLSWQSKCCCEERKAIRWRKSNLISFIESKPGEMKFC